MKRYQYFFHSPRGFCNEASVLAAYPGNEHIAELYERANRDPDESIERITRKRAYQIIGRWRTELRYHRDHETVIGPTDIEFLD